MKCSIIAGRSHTTNKSHTVAAQTHGAELCYCCDFFKALQRRCLPKDRTCAARSNRRVQYDVWQAWASESKSNIFLYFWLNKVLEEKIAFLQRVLELKNDMVSVAGLCDGLSCEELLQTNGRVLSKRVRAALKWKATSGEAIIQQTDRLLIITVTVADVCTGCTQAPSQ